jgi:hypothetical protein
MVKFRDFCQSMESVVDAIVVFVNEEPMANRQVEVSFTFQRLKRSVAIQVDKNEFRIA